MDNLKNFTLTAEQSDAVFNMQQQGLTVVVLNATDVPGLDPADFVAKVESLASTSARTMRDDNYTSIKEKRVLADMRDRGFAVITFRPEETEGINVRAFEQDAVNRLNELLEEHKDRTYYVFRSFQAKFDNEPVASGLTYQDAIEMVGDKDLGTGYKDGVKWSLHFNQE